MDLTIDRISLDLQDAAGHEHRVQPIVARAVALLGERLVVQGEQASTVAPGWVDAVSAAPIRLDLARCSDEVAAIQIADGMLAAIAPHLGGWTGGSGTPASWSATRAMRASPLPARRAHDAFQHPMTADSGGEPWPR